MSPKARIFIERRIVQQLLRHMAARGWVPYCNDDGGAHVYCVANEAAAMKTVFSVDESRLHFIPASVAASCPPKGTANKDARKQWRENFADASCHAVLLICGNGEDIISDWSFADGDADGFNAAMEAFDSEKAADLNALIEERARLVQALKTCHDEAAHTIGTDTENPMEIALQNATAIKTAAVTLLRELGES